MRRADSLEKTLMLGKIEGKRKMTEDEMDGWHHWLNGHEFEHSPGDDEGQRSLVCCSQWGHKESDMTQWLNNNSSGRKYIRMHFHQKSKGNYFIFLLKIVFLNIYHERDYWCDRTQAWGEIKVQFSSITQSCPTFCDPMNRCTPGLPVHHKLPEFTQTHIHQVSDAIQPSHPLLPPSPPAPNPSQNQSLFQ